MKKIIIKPRRGFESLGLSELFEYRDLLIYNILKNIKGKYRQMALGPLWIILQPIVNMLLFTLIFGRIAKIDSGDIPYPVMVLVALIPWNFFQNATTFAANSLVSQMNVISKVYFPRMIIPLADTFAWLFDFVITFVILLLIMVYYGICPGWRVVFLPFYILFLFVTTIALGLLTASITVKYRDVKLLVDYGLRIFVFITPVAYPATILEKSIPHSYFWLLKLNPLYWITEGFRWTLLGSSPPPDLGIVYSIFLILIILVFGAFIFRRSERTIVDLL